ncbi:MAG: hypothetical protein K6C69_08170 [Lachnospiraceae bacterium]|nr:hypothetical protein [Lachnospiraceae bacterium]
MEFQEIMHRIDEEGKRIKANPAPEKRLSPEPVLTFPGRVLKRQVYEKWAKVARFLRRIPYLGDFLAKCNHAVKKVLNR